MKEFFNKPALKITRVILSVIFYSFLILFVVVVLMQKVSNNKLSFFNYRMFTVISGSMKPVYDIGDVLISKDVDHDDILVNDIITYNGKAGSFNDKVITHRVIDIKVDENNKKYYITKGEANPVADAPVCEDDVIGKVIYKSNFLSFISRNLTTPIGITLFVVLPLVYIIGSEMIASLIEKEDRRRERLAKQKENNNSEE